MNLDPVLLYKEP